MLQLKAEFYFDDVKEKLLCRPREKPHERSKWKYLLKKVEFLVCVDQENIGSSWKLTSKLSLNVVQWKNEESFMVCS